MDNSFDLIKKKLSLLDYAKKFLRLKNAGDGKFVALCPFHTEKTPSFHINTKTDLFFCFGCGKGGDLFSFHCFLNGCDKKKALFDLAAVVGVSLTTKKNINPLNLLLQFFLSFQNHLSFLKQRGVSSDMITKFQLGWAPSFQEISAFLQNKRLNFDSFGFSTAFFKFFQNRVVFPIFDECGSLISFAGRCLDSRSGKYVNGAESSLFLKGEVLFNLHLAKGASVIYLVEGYLDVIALAQKGLMAVASMGTAISKAQISLLLQHTNKIVVCFDADNAGRQAAEKVAFLALECIAIGKEFSFLFLPHGEDPDSYLLTHNSFDALKEVPLFEFFLVYKPIPDNPDKKALFFSDLFALASKINDKLLRSEYLKKWRDFRWAKKSLFCSEKLHSYDYDSLILLLFKYVFVYNQLLDHVAEDFLKLDMKESFKSNLLRFLNSKSLDPDFLLLLDNVLLFHESSENFDILLNEWYKIFKHVQNIFNNERKLRLLNNFSQSEWALFQKWLEQKELDDD